MSSYKVKYDPKDNNGQADVSVVTDYTVVQYSVFKIKKYLVSLELDTVLH